MVHAVKCGCEKPQNFLGQLVKQSLASAYQNRVLRHFQLAQRFHVNTIYREQFYESI